MKLNLLILTTVCLFCRVYLDEVQSNILDTPSSDFRPSPVHKTLEDRLNKVEKELEDDEEFETLTLQLSKKLNHTTNQLKYLKQEIHEINEKLDSLTESNGHFHSKIQFPKHCREIQDSGQNASGIYTIQPQFAEEPFLVLCDMDTRGGGWTYFLNRFNGNQDFFLSWDDYKNGFGNLADEFWLGLEHLYQLTGYEVNELLIELEDWDSKEAYAHYKQFSIGSENEGYSLKLLGGYNGDAGDSLIQHAGMKFTTKDKDQDRYKGGNCATYRIGGWWYRNCVTSHLTGKYLRGTTVDKDEFNILYWENFRGSKYSLKEARMMVRPRN